MEFKFDKRKRIKFSRHKIVDLVGDRTKFFHECVASFQKECGLQMTTVKFNRYKQVDIYSFKLIDKQKYLVAKIKYGI
jgi:hypothetical protein